MNSFSLFFYPLFCVSLLILFLLLESWLFCDLWNDKIHEIFVDSFPIFYLTCGYAIVVVVIIVVVGVIVVVVVIVVYQLLIFLGQYETYYPLKDEYLLQSKFNDLVAKEASKQASRQVSKLVGRQASKW